MEGFASGKNLLFKETSMQNTYAYNIVPVKLTLSEEWVGGL